MVSLLKTSDVNSNPNINRYESLDRIRNMVGLGNNNQQELKGASENNNIPLCDKTKKLINIKNLFGLI